MLKILFFSPTGTTEQVARLISSSIGMDVVSYDLTTRETDIHLDPDDVVLFASPVYAGRIQQLALQRFSSLKGSGQRAIAIVVYGNRDYDDALLELCDLATDKGFEIAAAGAFIAKHCIFPTVATFRPDFDDREKISRFVADASQALRSGTVLDLNKVKGQRPYKKPGAVPIHPKVDRNVCNSCGKCVTECPVGAISIDDPRLTDTSKCITCCRCIHVCPSQARKMGGLLYKVAGWKFVRDNSRRREPEWFV